MDINIYIFPACACEVLTSLTKSGGKKMQNGRRGKMLFFKLLYPKRNYIEQSFFHIAHKVTEEVNVFLF